MKHSSIISTGIYLPSETLHNEDLDQFSSSAKLMISAKTGIFSSFYPLFSLVYGDFRNFRSLTCKSSIYARKISAAHQAWAMQPRGACGQSASKISEMVPMPASYRCGMSSWKHFPEIRFLKNVEGIATLGDERDPNKRGLSFPAVDRLPQSFHRVSKA